MNDDATPAKVRLTEELGPLPAPAPQFAPRWPNDEAGYTADQMRAYAAEQVAAERDRWLDCRTCRHHTTSTGGCISVLACQDGSAYQRGGVRHCWTHTQSQPHDTGDA